MAMPPASELPLLATASMCLLLVSVNFVLTGCLTHLHATLFPIPSMQRDPRVARPVDRFGLVREPNMKGGVHGDMRTLVPPS
jgi:hypothetical protein